MITMSNLGKNGRLGNQLFQFAFLFGLSKAKGYDFCIPTISDHYKNYTTDRVSSSLLECFDLPAGIISTNPPSLNIIKEKRFCFDESFPDKYDDNCNYSGYYQSDKYFKHYNTDLIQILKFKEKYKVPPKQDPKELVSIHVRRGDYVGNATHPVIGMEYIKQAKREFVGKKFIVFSDDIDWCQLNNVGDYYADNKIDCVDLYQMSLCSGSIISNSSFSWWGAYMGSDKEKVIAPKKWFNNETITGDVYCKGWIIT